MYFKTILPVILALVSARFDAAAVAVSDPLPDVPEMPEISADTTMTDITLGEITVSAPKVIHKVDMDVFVPSESAVKASQNGMALLRYLMIPTLNINEMTGSIRTSGQNVQIRINGRKASPDQLQTIDPASVRRIEWIDDAGLRYGSVPAVLNVVMVNLLKNVIFVTEI